MMVPGKWSDSCIVLLTGQPSTQTTEVQDLNGTSLPPLDSVFHNLLGILFRQAESLHPRTGLVTKLIHSSVPHQRSTHHINNRSNELFSPTEHLRWISTVYLLLERLLASRSQLLDLHVINLPLLLISAGILLQVAKELGRSIDCGSNIDELVLRCLEMLRQDRGNNCFGTLIEADAFEGDVAIVEDCEGAVLQGPEEPIWRGQAL